MNTEKTHLRDDDPSKCLHQSKIVTNLCITPSHRINPCATQLNPRKSVAWLVVDTTRTRATSRIGLDRPGARAGQTCALQLHCRATGAESRLTALNSRPSSLLSSSSLSSTTRSTCGGYQRGLVPSFPRSCRSENTFTLSGADWLRCHVMMRDRETFSFFPCSCFTMHLECIRQ